MEMISRSAVTAKHFYHQYLNCEDQQALNPVATYIWERAFYDNCSSSNGIKNEEQSRL